jgi:hypothetical protein
VAPAHHGVVARTERKDRHHAVQETGYPLGDPVVLRLFEQPALTKRDLFRLRGFLLLSRSNRDSPEQS